MQLPLVFLREEVLWKRTVDLWISVKTGIDYIASRALLMDPFDSLLLLSETAWDTSWLKLQVQWNLCEKLTGKHFLSHCETAVAGIVCCFIFVILHFFSQSSKEVFAKAWWELKLSSHKANDSLLIIHSWEEDTAKYFFLWRKVGALLRALNMWRSLFGDL